MTARSQRSEVGDQRPANLKAEMEMVFRKLWNRVEDGLPNNDTLVMIYRDGLFDLGHRAKGRWVDEASGCFLFDVTHWMPVIGPEVKS